MTQDKGYGYTNCQYCGASLKGGHQCNQAPLEGNPGELSAIATDSKPVMKCGHGANATADKGQPVCAICFGFTPDAEIVDTTYQLQPDRIAKCHYGGHKPCPSSPSLAFFNARPDQDHDTYYCGCLGWD